MAGYNVYRDGEVVDTVTTTNSLDTGLNAATLYSYNVTAFDKEGNESAPSAAAAATTLAPVPVLVGESFEYTAGISLSGLDGGTGWSGPWGVGAASTFPATIQSGGLGTYPGLGNHLRFWAKGNGNTYQNLDRTFESLISDGAQTVWYAMQVALYDAKNAATWTLTGLTTDATGTNPANLFSLGATIPATFKFGSTTLFTGDTNRTPHLILVRIAMSGNSGAETLTAYHDPNLTADPGTWTGVTRTDLYANGGLIGFSYRGGRASSPSFVSDIYMDEIRIGGTWQAAVGLAPDTEAPSVPANVAATAQSSSSIVITWDASTDNVSVTGYEVQRNGTNSFTVAANSYTDTGLAASTLYSYTVKARDAATNVSAASAPASAMTLPPPTLLVEESFTNAAGNLVGLTGGIGWAGGWTVDSHYDYEANAYAVAAGVLTNYPGLTGSGNYGSFLSGGGGTYYPWAQRNLATPLIDDGGIYWLAFQLQARSYHKNSSFTLREPPAVHLSQGRRHRHELPISRRRFSRAGRYQRAFVPDQDSDVRGHQCRKRVVVLRSRSRHRPVLLGGPADRVLHPDQRQRFADGLPDGFRAGGQYRLPRQH